MFYQWGRKEPYTFATSSEYNGFHYGKYPVKIYTIDGVLIYQDDNGRSNTDKQPAGGVIFSSTPAISMIEVIKNPLKLYGEWSGVINYDGHTKELWDYYWTSYSRGVDGNVISNVNYLNMHNRYLDGYTSKRFKSIYDPCPYGYRVPANGTYNQFKSNPGWVRNSYISGYSYNGSWLSAVGSRSDMFSYVGYYDFRRSSILSAKISSSTFGIYSSGDIFYVYNLAVTQCYSVRCIEELCSSIRPDRRTRC